MEQVEFKTVMGGVEQTITIEISTEAPPEVTNRGCTVYTFLGNRLTGMALLIPSYRANPNAEPTWDRHNSFVEPSPLDLGCVQAIIEHYNQAPPPEVHCILLKLDRVAVESVTSTTTNTVIDGEAKEIDLGIDTAPIVIDQTGGSDEG